MSVAIGERGRAMTALHPSGTVEINGAPFRARCVRRIIEAGTEVVVTGRDAEGQLLCAAVDLVDRKTLLNLGDPGQDSEDKLAVEKSKEAAAWDGRVYAVFLVTVFSICPVIGVFAQGLEGFGMGILADFLLVLVFAFGGGLPSITPTAE